MKYSIFLLLFAQIIFNACRLVSEKEKCDIDVKSIEDSALCGGASFLIPIGSILNETDEENQKFLNLILVDCLRIAEAKRKCKSKNSNLPTII